MTRKINYTFIPRDWLVGEWLLDWNTNDTSWNWKNGTATDVSWVDAERWYISKWASFNGSSSYIDLWNKMTDAYYWISVWANITDNWNRRRFVDFGEDSWSDWQFVISKYQDTNKIMYRNWKNDYPSADGYLIYNERHHYVIYQKGDTIYFYRDWILHSTTNTSETPQSHSRSHAYIWKSNRSADPLYKWQMVLLRTYNRVLSPTEIQALYQEGLRKLWPTNLLPSPNTKVRDWLLWEWNLDNNALDTSWNWNDWTPTDVVYNPVWGWWVGNFNGSSSKISIPDNSNILNWASKMYASVWAKTTTNWKRFIFSGWEYWPWLIKNNASNNVETLIKTSDSSITNSSNINIIDGKWHFLELLYDWNNQTLFVDTINVKSSAQTWTLQYLNTPWKITIWYNSLVSWDGEFFSWQIWLPRLYNRIPSQQERSQQYQEWLKYIHWNKYSLPPLEQGKVLKISKPQSWWTYYDQTWSWHNWTAHSVTDSTVGKSNVMSFNGSSSYINIWDVNNYMSDTITFSTIVKFDSFDGHYRTILKNWFNGFGYWLQINKNSNNNNAGDLANHIVFRIVQWDWSRKNLQVNYISYLWKYTHITGVIDNWNFYLYINWVLKWSSTYSDIKTGNWNALIWAYNTSGTNVLKWDLSLFRIYNRVLSPTEIQQLYYSQIWNFLP